MRRICHLVLAMLAASSQATAAEPSEPTVDLQLFHLTPSSKGLLSVEGGEVNNHLSLSVGLNVVYAHKPLAVHVVWPDGREEASGAIVKHRTDINLLLGVGLFDLAEIRLAMPMVLQGGMERSKLDGAGVPVGDLKGETQGDLRAGFKIKPVDVSDGTFALAIVGTYAAPTAMNAPYAGEASWGAAEAGLALSSRMGLVRLALDLGYRMRDRATTLTLVVKDEIFYRLGLGIDLVDNRDGPIEIVGELYGHTPGTNPWGLSSSAEKKKYQSARSPLEGVLGARITFLDNFVVTAGAGGGLLPGYGAAAPRAFAGLMYFTGQIGLVDEDGDGIADDLDQCPQKKEDRDGFEDLDGCPELDNDKDRVLDEDDNCPLEPEDRDGLGDEDGCPETDFDEDKVEDEKDACPKDPEDHDTFEDEDGCPDPDNDADGIPDKTDECPKEAEDKDGFKDADGCPEPDNDGDGLPDLGDMCPNHAEDKDGVVDDDGCPEDNDGDGILDEQDKCPNKPEIYNGVDDEDGCPEKIRAKSLVKVTDEKIEIKEKIFFKSGSARILSKSFGLLDQIAAVLKNYKHITRVRIEGHTDSRGSKRRNKKLSQERAESVRSYLTGKGVEPERLEAKGFGSEKPISSNSSRRGRELNRRVEFVIVEKRQIGEDISEIHGEPEFELEPVAPPAGEEPTFEIGPSEGEQVEAGGEVEFDLGASDNGEGTEGTQPAGDGFEIEF